MCDTAQAMLDWNDLRYVLETVRQGGLSGAARTLKVNHATVSRRIAAAEAAMGARLFDRLPGGYRPTDAGLEAARAAEQMEQSSTALGLSIAARDRQLRGTLKITAPQLMVERVLAPILLDFRAAQPEIDVEVVATNEVLNLAQREADVAFRFGTAPSPTLVGVRMTEQKAAAYVGLAQLERLKADPSLPLDWIKFAHWPGLPKEITSVWPHRRVTLVVDDMIAAIGAVRAGIGATRMACFLGDTDPELARLPRVALFDYAPIWLLTHPDLKDVPRVAVFMQFAAARIRKMRPFFEGQKG
ncbi:LysR family transcriptional regulator [uncultured Litoreibacter sp.]|uniref:LysR family transcriptional regulator n=1 Tax=uncultured Litoreibacter sp. TaxID=1392394 RepID=UPI0026231F31|nr:LysR family transcriptional regulator [uncultured Litoreibacter sp.]